MRYFWLSLLLSSAACNQSPVKAPSSTAQPLPAAIAIQVQNPSHKARPAVNVSLALASLGSANPQELAVVDNGQELPAQVDDVDLDGTLDTLVFQVNLAPKQQKQLNIEQRVPSRFPKRTHAVVHPEFEGPGWESELVSYRMYLDGRNAIDVFGKAEPVLALDRYAKSGKNYHEVQPWGVDVLHVGDSLGLGSFGFWARDAIVKPTETLRTKAPNNSLRRFVQVVADGPVRSIVRFTYDNWIVDAAPRKVTATHTIWAGQRWATSELDVGPNFHPTVAVGVIALKSAPVTQKEEFFYTYGAQSDEMSDTKKAEILGLGIVFRKSQFSGFVAEAATEGAINTQDRTRVVLLKPDDKGRVSWAYLAAWERGSLGVRDTAAMQTQCEAALVELTEPVSVELK